jgi:Helix-turn-helix domain
VIEVVEDAEVFSAEVLRVRDCQGTIDPSGSDIAEPYPTGPLHRFHVSKHETEQLVPVCGPLRLSPQLCGASICNLQGGALKSREYVHQYSVFLRRLREAREATGLTQAEVDRKLSRPQSFVSKCESGERRVDFIELRFFARIYRKPVSYFEPS